MTTTTAPVKRRVGRRKKWDRTALTILAATYELLRRQTGYKREAVCEQLAAPEYVDAPWNRGGRLNADTINKMLSHALSLEENPVAALSIGPADSVGTIKRRMKERAKDEGYASRISDRDFARAAREAKEDAARSRTRDADLIIEFMAWRPLGK